MLRFFVIGAAPSRGVLSRLSHKGVAQYKITPSSSIRSTPAATVVVFVPESGGKPARASIHQLGQLGDEELSDAVTVRTMFNASDASIYWNKSGSHVVILTSCDVDSSGRLQ
jgi:uncharacterized protein with WD repeat